jgi:histidinol-phosphatase (PHP family)
MQPILYETHMHTPLCRHATGEPEEYAAVAIERGLRGVIVTCHNPMPDGYAQSSRMYAEQFEEYLALVQRARDRMAGRTDVRLGLECDYIPGAEPWLERQLASAEFHYVLGSIHPHVNEYRTLYWTGDAEAYQRLYFEHLAQAAETGLFDCLSHPDLVKNVNPEAWRPEVLMEHMGAYLDRIAATGVAMELNTSGVHKVVREMNPGVPILRQMHARGIPVVVGADAHVPERVGESFAVALGMLAEVGYEHVSLFLDRRRQEIAIDAAQKSLEGGS